jgi:hypothetical protein
MSFGGKKKKDRLNVGDRIGDRCNVLCHTREMFAIRALHACTWDITYHSSSRNMEYYVWTFTACQLVQRQRATRLLNVVIFFLMLDFPDKQETGTAVKRNPSSVTGALLKLS